MGKNNLGKKTGIIFLLFFLNSSPTDPTINHTDEFYSPQLKYKVEIKEISQLCYKVTFIENKSKKEIFTYNINCVNFCEKTLLFSPNEQYIFINPSFCKSILIEIETGKILSEGNKIQTTINARFSENSKILFLSEGNQETSINLCPYEYEKSFKKSLKKSSTKKN